VKGRGAMVRREFDFKWRRHHRPAAAYSVGFGIGAIQPPTAADRPFDDRLALADSKVAAPAPRFLDASGSAPSPGRDARDHTRGWRSGDKVGREKRMRMVNRG
jgi:hypothetical protein